MMEEEIIKLKQDIQELENLCNIKDQEIRRLHASCRSYDDQLNKAIPKLVNLRDFCDQLSHTYSRGQVQQIIEILGGEED